MESSVVDLSLFQMVAVYGILFATGLIVFHLKLGLIRDGAIAVCRMSVQLLLVGLYLKFIFDLNSLALTLVWMLTMVIIANFSILKKSGLQYARYFCYTFSGLAFSTSLITSLFVIVIIRPDPVFDARYLIPIFGMILGNCMRGNIICLERFYSSINSNQKEYLTRLMLGATRLEAVKPYFQSALTAALAPHLSTMATMGIVSLPGMMTGQMLGGSVPITAIKYQIAIMVCIFSSLVITSVLNLLLTMRISFTEFDMLKMQS